MRLPFMAVCCSHARAPRSTRKSPQSSRRGPLCMDVGLNARRRPIVYLTRRKPMRRLGLVPVLALAAACAPVRADLTVDWTFGGKSCADAGVAWIQVHIDGEVLTPDRYSCAVANQGAYLGRYLP